MPKKKPCITGTLKCTRLPYPDCGEGRKPKPTGAAALLQEFIQVGSIGGKKRNAEKIENIGDKDVFSALSKIAPLLLNQVSLSDWKENGIKDLWIKVLSEASLPTLIPKKAKIEILSKKLEKDLPDNNIESKTRLPATFIRLYNFSYSSYVKKLPKHILAMDNCLKFFKQIHLLICHLLAPSLVMPSQEHYKRIKENKAIQLSFRLHFKTPDYKAYVNSSPEWIEQQDQLKDWFQSVLENKFEEPKFDIHLGFPRQIHFLKNMKDHQFFEFLIHKLANIIFDAFNPYSEKFMSWGQLYTGVCMSCGAIIVRKRIDSPYCCDSCKSYRSKNK